MTYTTYRYARLIKRNRRETYTAKHVNRRTENISLSLMYFFILGYLGAFVYAVVSDVEFIFLFIALIFFFGAIFVYASVKAQISMSDQLRGKTMEVMRTFVNAIDMKDSYTKGHSEHVYEIVDLFYEELPEKLKNKINQSMLLDAALLHDIGKLSIKDEVLNKPGPLDADDWEVIKTHPEKGKKILDDTCFCDISGWVLLHHERMDGNGYYRVAGEGIPLEARIIAIADTYSALCTDRVYRSKRSHIQAMTIMEEASGKQLDTELMKYFLKIQPSKLEKLVGEA